MVTPLMSISRLGENRRNNAKYTPVGMTVISPTESISPIDTRMTPIRKSLFQKRRVTSAKRRNESSFMSRIEDDSRDDSNEIESLRSANKKKDGHLKILHNRFTHIQKGLGSIDEERNQLVEKAKRLDKEKKLILKQLELREREILTLIKRCASQEEKMRESSKLRSTNRKLQNHLEVISKKLQVIEDETQDRQSLEKLLQDSELEREQLRDRLAKVQKEHDAIADTLQECLGNIRQLTEEKHEIEEERRRERKTAEIELEQQHLAHVNDSNNLKENIQEHQSRILQMERILKDKIKSNTDLRREKAVISQGQHQEIQEVVELYERQLKELRSEIEETMTEKKKGSEHGTRDLKEVVSLMKDKLESKDHLIQDLETEFSDQMVKLISKQSSLDEAEEEKRDLELKLQSSRKLEIEHAALLDFVEILDSNLIELTTTNAYLELEKDTLQEETDELQKKANILQKQLSSLQNNHKAKEIDFRQLLNAEKDELQTELQESLRKSKSEAISLQAELESRNEWISKLEIDLNQARKLIGDKEDEINSIVNEMENLRSNLGTDLRRARLQAAQFEADVYAKNQTLASLEGRLEGAKEIREAGKNFEQDKTINKENERVGLVPLEHEIEHLHEQLQSREIDSKKVRTNLERTIQEVRNEAMFLQQKITSLTEEKAIIEKEVEESRSLINGRDEQIVEVQQLVLKHKKRSHELQRKLQYTTKELEDHKEKLSAIAEDDFVESLESNTQSRESANVPSLNSDTKKPTSSYKELEERIRVLERELSETQLSRSQSSDDLEEANKMIEKLEKQLVGEDTRTESLQNQLQDATKDMLEEESKANIMEDEYHSTVYLQIERENHNEETRSKIAILEDKIEEMKKQSNDLGIQIKASTRENMEKNEMISSLQADLVEGREETKEHLSELHTKCTEIENLELLLMKKDKDLNTKIEITNASLRSKEDRILELENVVSSNEGDVKSLEDSLSEAKHIITQLEHRICRDKDEKTILEEQLRAVNATTANARSLDNDFLPSSDTSDLKRKIQVLLTRQTDLSTVLDKTKAILVAERESWSVKESNFYQELSIFKAKLLVLQNVLIERERVITTLQKVEKDDDNQKMITESHFLEAENVISNLKGEIKLKKEKIDYLEHQIVNEKENGIQYAFVESDKQRLEIEDELAAAQRNIEELTASTNAREKQLNELEEALEKTRKEIAEKNENILSAAKEYKVLKEKTLSLDEKLRGGKEQIFVLNNELTSTRTKSMEKEQIINDFNKSTQSLKEVANKASIEISRKNEIVANLRRTADNLNLDLEEAKRNITTKDDTIKCLEDSLKTEKESRMKLEGEIAVTRDYVSESQKIKECLKKELENEKQGRSKVEENLSDAKKDLELLNHSSSEQISRLESQVSEMTSDLTRKEIEIRDLRLEELMGARKTANSLAKEAASWKAEALKKNLEYSVERESFVSQIKTLKSELQTLSSNTKDQDVKRDKDIDSSRKMIESLRSSNQELESNLKKLSDGTNHRDAIIEKLKKSLLQGAHGETEIRKQRDALQRAESEARDQLETVKAEYEETAAREREFMDIRIRDKDSLHKEELENTLFELESTLKKLQDSESLLTERGCRLGEMVDHNRDIELELEKEQTERRKIEEEFVQEQNNLEMARTDLNKLQAEIRRKESVLESKFKEECIQKEYAEESLRIAKTKYKEAMKTKRNVTELERENSELKDKILRQEAYLQRKLQKEKIDRARFTPNKSIASPGKSALRTPSKRSTNSSRPPTIGRGIYTGIPSIHKSRSKTSPTAASCRSTKTTRSNFSKNTQYQTPSRPVSTLSAQDILQSELDDDRSVASELSSILRSPKAHNSSSAKVPDWELEVEPREL